MIGLTAEKALLLSGPELPPASGMELTTHTLFAKIARVRADNPVEHERLGVLVRVNAGVLLADGWLNDRREGGRVLGEDCHFINLFNDLVEGDPATVLGQGAGRTARSLETGAEEPFGLAD